MFPRLKSKRNRNEPFFPSPMSVLVRARSLVRCRVVAVSKQCDTPVGRAAVQSFAGRSYCTVSLHSFSRDLFFVGIITIFSFAALSAINYVLSCFLSCSKNKTQLPTYMVSFRTNVKHDRVYPVQRRMEDLRRSF